MIKACQIPDKEKKVINYLQHINIFIEFRETLWKEMLEKVYQKKSVYELTNDQLDNVERMLRARVSWLIPEEIRYYPCVKSFIGNFI